PTTMRSTSSSWQVVKMALTAASSVRTSSVGSERAIRPVGSETASPTRRAPQSTARMRDTRRRGISGEGTIPVRRAAHLHETYGRAAREIELNLIHARPHDEDAAAARVEQVLGARDVGDLGGRAEGLAAIVHHAPETVPRPFVAGVPPRVPPR